MSTALSILALVVALASATFTALNMRTGVLARRASRRPTITLTVEDGGWLSVLLEGPEDLDRVDFELAAVGTVVGGAAAIVGLNGENHMSGTLGPLKVGIPHRTKILERVDGEGGSSLIRMEAHQGRATWVLSDRFRVIGPSFLVL